MKKAYSLFLIILIAYSLIFVSTIELSNADAGTTFSGIISSDTTWTQTGSPYTLNGNVLVSNGVTLTIQAGAVLNLGSYYIKVNGTIQAIGNSANPVTFNDGQITFTKDSQRYNKPASGGCIIEKGLLSSAISVEGGSPLISNSTLTGGISVNEGFPDISNNVIQRNGVSLQSQNVTVQNNIITNCNTGISYTTAGKFPCIIAGNLIINNTIGIAYNSFLSIGSDIPIIIENNTITRNTVGVSCSSSFTETYPHIIYNNIFENFNYNMLTSMEKTDNATFNWWGTTNSEAINQTIHDYYDDFELGVITFNPFSTLPNMVAPTFTNGSAGSGGSISTNGVTKLSVGDNQTFTITPNSGFHISDVLVNSTSVGAVGSYTVKAITGATTITAKFEADATPTPTTTASPSNPSSTPSSSSPSSTASPSSTPTVPETSLIILLPILVTMLLSTVTIKLKTAKTPP
jgi:hypothetical protein